MTGLKNGARALRVALALWLVPVSAFAAGGGGHGGGMGGGGMGGGRGGGIRIHGGRGSAAPDARGADRGLAAAPADRGAASTGLGGRSAAAPVARGGAGARNGATGRGLSRLGRRRARRELRRLALLRLRLETSRCDRTLAGRYGGPATCDGADPYAPTR